MTAVADAEEARLGMVVAQDAVKGWLRKKQPGPWPQLWGRPWWTEGRRERPFKRIRLVELIQLVSGVEHRPRRGDGGGRQLQATPSLVDVASSTERLRKLSVTEDSVKPVSSTLARARASAIATADATADARHEASVRRAYVTTGLKDVARTSALPFSASYRQGGGRATTHSVG